MGMEKIILRPGVNAQFTPTLNEGGWSESQLIRFKDGLVEKGGGWTKLIQTPVVGTARGSHAWADLDGNSYLAVGTEQRLQVVQYGTLVDITPLRGTENITPDFTTTSGDPVVEVVDTGHGAAEGDWINLVTPVSVGGVILYGFYQITEVLDANTYTITAADNPTASVSNGGAVPVFDTTNTDATIVVTFEDHGYSVGEQFVVDVSTTVGGLTLVGSYAVTVVTDADTFEFEAASVASSTATASENGGNVRIRYLIATGLASNTYVSGYTGPYSGPYGGVGNTPSLQPLRQWFLDNWGENLQGNFTDSTLYEWVPGSSDPAVAVSGAPTRITVSLVTEPQQIAMAFGCEIGSVFDPLLIRWSAVADNTDWVASAINQAGSFRLSTGSKIVGAIQAKQQVVVWTDVSCWVGQYIGTPFVWGWTQIGPQGNDLIAGRAVCNQGQSTWWVASRGFREMISGSIREVKSTVWDKIFLNLNEMQKEKLHLAPNALYNEITCYYPSATGDGEVDSYVKINTGEGNVWDYGVQEGSNSIVRTTWEDLSAMGNPIGVDLDGYIMQHEVGYDADGMPMLEEVTSGFFDIADGQQYIYIDRFLPDFKWFGTNPSLNLYVILRDYAGGENAEDELVKGPYLITPSRQYAIVRARARQAAIKIVGRGVGSGWRLGATRYTSSPSGRR